MPKQGDHSATQSENPGDAVTARAERVAESDRLKGRAGFMGCGARIFWFCIGLVHCRPGPGKPRGHIFLIFRYCCMSGNDVTASSPRAAAAAAIVTAVMYPSVRIVCLLFFG